MKKVITLLAFACFALNGSAQCFEIESILADACNGAPCPGGATEGENEMVRFKIGPAPLNYTNLSVIWPSTAAGGSSTPWRGIETSAAITNPIVSALNATITGCGYLKEPVGGILPANANVLMVTSTDMCTAGNSFANLADTLYIIFQVAGNTQGHFTNAGASAIRTLTMTFSTPASCSDAVSYDRALLTGGNGASIAYTPSGTATYYNNGCQAPIIPLEVDAGTSQSGCAGGSFNLAATASGTYSSVTWSGGTGSFGTPNALSTTYTPGVGESGTITLTVTIANNCGGSATDNISITLTAPPQPTITSSAGNAVCAGDSIQLTASNGAAYVWNPGNISATSIYVSTAGVYTVSSTTACGTTTNTFSLTVNPLPVAGVTASDSSICEGTTITLTASGAGNYSWSAGTSAGTGVSVTATPAASGSFTVTGTDGNGCEDTASVFITVNAVPVISSTATIVQPTCGSSDGSVSNLSITGGSNYGYSWMDASSTVMSTGPSATNLAAGSYTVTVVDNTTSCSGTQVFTLSNGGGPAAPTFVSNPTVCPGNSFTLTVSNPLAGAVYTWMLAGDTIQSAVDLTSITVNSADSANTGIYTVEVNNGSCPDFSTVTVTLASHAIAVVTGNTLFCQGDSTVLDASSSTPSTGATYQWYLGGSPIGSATAATYTVTAAGSYQVLVTNTDGCDSLSAAAAITVNPAPVVTVSNPSVCLNDSAAITASGANTYAWSAGTTPAAGDTVQVPGSSAGNFTYTVTGTDANNCTATVTATVTVNALPVIVSTTPPVTITPASCGLNNGGVAGATASGAAPVTYQWLNSSGVLMGNASDLNGVGGDVYSLIATDNNSCSDTVAFTVNSTGGLIQPVITGNPAFCQGTQTVLNASSSLPSTGASYQWYQGGNPIGGATGVTYTVTAAGSYQVQVTNTAGCDSLSAATNVTVNPLPAVTINGQQDATVLICSGVDTVLAGGGAVAYSWSTSANTSFITYTAAGTATVTVTGTDANGCTDSTHVFISIKPGPGAMPFLGTPTICNGMPTYLYVTDTISGQTYAWTTSSGTSLSSSDSVLIHTAGTYSLTITNSCGSFSQPIVVGQSTIDVSFVPDTTIGLAPLPIHFTNTSSNASAYFWSFGNGDTTYAVSPQTIYNEPGTYTVFLAGSNSAYCYDDYTVQIIVLEMNVFITMPNIFSPNEDDVNDFFGVKSYGITAFSCEIYDRWGLLIAELQNVKEKWTPGSDISEGTYFYIMKAKGIDGQEFESHGTILLVR
jgi:gliding motility-associated-like protein